MKSVRVENQNRKKRRKNVVSKLLRDYTCTELRELFREILNINLEKRPIKGPALLCSASDHCLSHKGRSCEKNAIMKVFEECQSHLSQASQLEFVNQKLEMVWSMLRGDVKFDFADRQMQIEDGSEDAYILSIRVRGETSKKQWNEGYVPWFSIRKSTIPDAGKGLFAEQSFSKGACIGIYFGSIANNEAADESNYSLYSSKMLEKRDAIGGFESGAKVFMGVHYLNDPDHDRYLVGQTEETRERDSKYLPKCPKHHSNVDVYEDFVLRPLTGVSVGTEMFMDYRRGPMYKNE